MNTSREQKLNQRIKQYGEKKYSEGYPDKARAIREYFDQQGWNTTNFPPEHWEYAGQIEAKLKVVINDPSKQAQKRTYEQALEQFDMKTGLFPNNIDPVTGKVKD